MKDVMEIYSYYSNSPLFGAMPKKIYLPRLIDKIDSLFGLFYGKPS